MGELTTVPPAKLKPEYIWFNENSTRKQILNMVLIGKSNDEIIKTLNIKEHNLIYTMNHPHFINKLNKKLQVLYTRLVVDKVRIQSDLLDLLYGTLKKTLPPDKRVMMKDEKIIRELINLTKGETNKVNVSKVEKNTSFIYNNNQGKERPKTEERIAQDEKELLESFGIAPEAETLPDE